ncbi:MAG: DMT family transporter [Bacillota bacterium]
MIPAGDAAWGREQALGVALVLVATVALSTEAVAAKIAYRGGATVLTVLALRYLVAALLFGAGYLYRPVPYRLGRAERPALLLLAVGGQAATVLALFAAFRYTTAAMAILFLYLYPTVVSILAHFFLREPLDRPKVLALALSLAGCVVILGRFEGLNLLGIGLAALAAVLNAVFLVGSARLLARVPVRLFNAALSFILTLFFLPLAFFTGELTFALTPQACAAILFLGVVCTVVSLASLFHGIVHIGASRAAIIATLEPPLTALWGYWLLGEKLTVLQAAGGILILAGVALQARART